MDLLSFMVLTIFDCWKFYHIFTYVIWNNLSPSYMKFSTNRKSIILKPHLKTIIKYIINCESFIKNNIIKNNHWIFIFIYTCAEEKFLFHLRRILFHILQLHLCFYLQFTTAKKEKKSPHIIHKTSMLGVWCDRLAVWDNMIL